MAWGAAVGAYLVKEWRIEASYRLNFALRFLGSVMELTIFFFIDRVFGQRVAGPLASYGVTYFSYVVVGLACASYAGVGASGLPQQLAKEQQQGTLELLLAAPLPTWVVIAAMAAWNTLWATVNAGLFLLGAAVLFGLSFPAANLLSVAVVWLLTVVAMAAVGLLDTALVLRFKRGHLAGYLLGMSWAVLGGVYFPIGVLPAWLRRLSAFLPTTHAVGALEAAVHAGAPLPTLWPHLGPLLVMAGAFALIGSVALQQALRAAKIRGSIAYA